MDKIVTGTPAYAEQKGEWDYNNRLHNLAMTLPFHCNIACRKCANEGLRNPDLVDRPEQPLLSFDEINDVVKEFSESGGKTINIIGEGEPFHPAELPRLIHTIEQAAKNNLRTIVFTNGTLLTEELINFCKDNLVTIMFSVDSLKKDLYKYLSGKSCDGNYNRLMQNIQKTCEIFKDTQEVFEDVVMPTRRKIAMRVGMNTVISQHNWGELDDIKKFRESEMIHIYGAPFSKGSLKGSEDEFVGEPENYKKIVSRTQELSDTGGCCSYSRELRRCTFMNNGIIINNRGDYGVCNYNTGVPEFGNWRDGGRMKDIEKRIHKKVDRFFADQGDFYCITRHDKSDKFIGTKFDD
ncbi:MAG: radical SAM protein [Patescibacteria group bacterium]|jgi:MoaA/NifB/PqqE/SkfB family radical SAM enzyme